ncbi:MAG TPA: SAM-dependent methyltransferase [Pseudonocardiaceae bacterium]|jgi:O-methyltransferase involved in polyketide biosynthesis|nr:SAM-dependent methyltransferase [Pseudonocardiaceae bacterium]
MERADRPIVPNRSIVSNRSVGKVDVDRPSSARIYDYFLGGAHNFEVDREAAQALQRAHPAIGLGMRANRSYLRRAVTYLTSQGIDQFLDLGSGIPTVGNVHEIAQRTNPDAHVVYVDLEPIAVTHSNTILAGNDKATAIHADLRRPDEVLEHPDTKAMLDLERPIALIAAGVLQYIPDADDPAGIVAGYTERLAAGSYLAMSHPSQDDLTSERRAGTAAVGTVYNRTDTPFTYRTKAQFEALFAGLALVEPGVVHMWSWHAESDTEEDELGGRLTGFAGVARVP